MIIANSIVQNDLMTQEGYTPYCGSNVPRPPVGNGCDNPLTKFNGQQFVCPKCGTTTSFPMEFINEYKEHWKK